MTDPVVPKDEPKAELRSAEGGYHPLSPAQPVDERTALQGEAYEGYASQMDGPVDYVPVDKDGRRTIGARADLSASQLNVNAHGEKTGYPAYSADQFEGVVPKASVDPEEEALEAGTAPVPTAPVAPAPQPVPRPAPVPSPTVSPTPPFSPNPVRPT